MRNTPGREVRSSMWHSWLLILALVLAASTSFAQDFVCTLTTSRDISVTQSFIVSAPLAPALLSYVVILLPGGTGNIQLTPTTAESSSVCTDATDGTLDVTSNNWLVRSRWLFAGQETSNGGFYAISLDAATDFLASPTGLMYEQGSAAHVRDVLDVIGWARATVPGVPVWLVGTSRGTAGAFVAGLYSPPTGGPDGLVFTDNINDTTDPDSLLMASLSTITVPVLLMYDSGNTCTGTLNSGNSAVKKALKSSAEVKTETVTTAGLNPLTDSCKDLSDHGFFGVEETAAHKIALWIAAAPVI